MNVSEVVEAMRKHKQDRPVKIKVGQVVRGIGKIDLDGDYRDLDTNVVIEPTVPELVTPIVNNNGTSGEELIAQRRQVFEALGEAHRLLAEMSPHGRDYQTDPTGTAFKAAKRQHQRRRLAIEALRDELHKEALAILERR